MRIKKQHEKEQAFLCLVRIQNMFSHFSGVGEKKTSEVSETSEVSIGGKILPSHDNPHKMCNNGGMTAWNRCMGRGTR
jgi:hypothetical protein